MVLARNYSIEVCVLTFFTSIVLLLVSIASQFRVYIEAVARGALEASAIIPIMFFLLPQFLGLILPISFYIGVVVVLMRTLRDNEFIVLRSCGLSQLGFARILVLPTIMVTLLSLLLQLLVIPEGIAQVAKITAKNNSLDAFEFIAPKRFNEISDNTHIYVDGFESENAMQRVFLYALDSQQTTSLFSQTASLDKQQGTRYLRLNNGQSYNVSTTGKITHIAFASADIDITPEVPILSLNKIDALPTSTLLTSNNPKEISLLWWRISLGVLAPILFFCLVATQNMTPRRSSGLRLLGIFGICITYISCLFSVQALAESGAVYPALPYIAVHVLFILCAVFWYIKIRV